MTDLARAPRPALSPQARRRRRRAMVQWSFVGLAVLLTVAFFFVMIVVVPAISHQEPVAQPDEVSAVNTTQFTEAGIEFAETNARITLNLSELPLTAADVGMGQNDTATVTADGLTQVTMYTGLGDPGFWRAMSETFTIVTENGEVTGYEFGQARTNWAEFNTIIFRLNNGVTTFGWVFDNAVQQELTSTIAESVRNNVAVSYTIAAGSAFGFPVSAEVRCDETAFCQLVPHFAPNE